MRKLVVIILFLGNICLAQSRIIYSEKIYCKQTGNDTSECEKLLEKSSFNIDMKESFIYQSNSKTVFLIDSKVFDPNTNTTIYKTHTETGERHTISISSKTITINSIDYPEISIEYKIDAVWK